MAKNYLTIGVPKEIKNKEGRVGLTPSAVRQILDTKKCKVAIEHNAGVLSGYNDENYKNNGAEIEKNAESIYKKADLIVKIKEILPAEYDYLRMGQAIFTYLHPADNPAMVDVFLKKKITSVSYDTIETANGELPVLKPMSVIAGRLAIDKGVGIKPDIKNVAIVGGGAAGLAALKQALKLNLQVTMLDVDRKKLSQIKNAYPEAKTIESNPANISKLLYKTDLLVGAVLIAGKKAPIIITKSMLGQMPKGSVIVDISIDQGGCCETSRPTTHENPTYEISGIIHYCVANVPGCVPQEATMELVKAHLPYTLEICAKGIKYDDIAIWSDELKSGLVTVNGRLVNRRVADDLGLEYAPMESAQN